jgi:hypothetical protein
VAQNDDVFQGHLEHLVKRNKVLNPALPVHDYRPALQCAVSWLGDRYLLAAPVRRAPERKPFFAETRGWFPSTRQ